MINFLPSLQGLSNLKKKIEKPKLNILIAKSFVQRITARKNDNPDREMFMLSLLLHTPFTRNQFNR